MVDRQDIDALLVGALYGELTLADEARLATHLESHPADRGALDDLKSARQAVRDSRIFAVQLEPPQAVSALLLQEAARRAPRRAPVEGESWVGRVARAFMSHPAMAAAVMLVVVVGVASTLYFNKGADFAEPTASAPAQEQANVPAPAPQDVPATPSADHAAAGSSYAVGLADDNEQQRGQREQVARRHGTDGMASSTAQPSPKAAPQATPQKKPYVEAFTATATPKEMDKTAQTENQAVAGADDHLRLGEPTGRAAPGANGGAGMAAPAKHAPAPMAPPPPPMAIAEGPTDPRTNDARTVTKAEPAPSTPKRDDSALVAWAKGQHDLARSLTRGGKCDDVAKVAVDVKNRAPDYYAQFMATDRALKPCAPSITNAADKDAERSSKARAQKRVNADEAAPAMH